MHARLFGEWGFAAFPFVILVLTAATYHGLLSLGFTAATVAVGLHYIVFFFGLNVGTIGFASQEALQNILGEANMLIFSSHTLPIGRRRVLATFLVKDLLYYAGLFLVPIVLGIAGVDAVRGIGAAAPWLLVLSTTGAFMLGVAVSFAGATLYLRGTWAVIAGTVVAAATVAVLRTDILAYTPLALYREPSVATMLQAFVPVVAIAYLALYFFRPENRVRARTTTDLFSPVKSMLWFDQDGLVTKSLLDMGRSSGGPWKLLVSEGIIVGVFVFLIRNVPALDTFLAAPGLGFAIILSMASLAVYSWMNRFDTTAHYLRFPLSYGDVLRGKFIAFMVLSLPISTLYLLGIAAWFGTTGLAAGVLLLPLLSIYLFGVTAYLTGTQTDRLLFDTGTFLLFGAAVSLVIIPLFITALLYPQIPEIAPSFAVLFAGLAGYVGFLLYRRAGPKWAATLQEG